MVDRISSFGHMNTLVDQAMRLQSRYAATNNQTASGLKSESYDGIARDSQRLLNLESQFTSITAQIEGMKASQNRLNAMQEATTGISELLTNVMARLTQAMSGGSATNTAAITVAQADAWLGELGSLLNSRYGDSYLFAGSVKDGAPVNLSDPDYDPTQTASPNTEYYQGDDKLDSVRASEHLKVSYGVTAADSAFELAIRALQLLQQNPTDMAALNQVHALISASSDAVTDITATLASKSDVLGKEIDTQTAMLDYLDTNITDLRNVDLAKATIELAQIETQLEASFSTLSTLLKLKLTDFLR